MTDVDRGRLEQRALVLAPTSKDATLTESVLTRAGLACACCAELDELCDELEAGAGVVLLPEEAVAPEQDGRLFQWLARQPPWSDLPVLVLARPGADSSAVAQAMDLLSNVTVLERPIRVSALVSAVRTALRARQRQYQIRDHLEQHRKAEEALRDADRRKDEFLAVLAHELRNPLAPIYNSLHVLRTTGAQDSIAKSVSEMMERQVNHMVRLVDDLLEVSRITCGKIVLRKESVDVAGIVRSAVETSQPFIDAPGHELIVEIAPEPLVVEGDPVRLIQVVSNLLNNAAKYTDAGGRIWLTVRKDGNDAAISVRDTGVGIPASMLPRVFELFAQVDRPAGLARGGLGIGLTLVKTLAELHGGSVHVHSDGDERGSEFVVRLPLASVQVPTQPDSGESSAPALHASPKVLVVDDNRDAADSLGMLLGVLGTDFRIVYDGPSALAAVATYKPDVVLLDIGMPGMDGHEVARRIRQQPQAQNVTLVALTGWGQEEDRSRSEAAGFDRHLIKPADIGALKALFQTVLERGGSPLSGDSRAAFVSRAANAAH